MRSKISEIQADRKNIFRKVGETLCHIWRETEENTLWKSRRALFGEDFREMYELLQNRFLFVEGGNDEYLFLEHYVLLGNFMNDPDRFGSVRRAAARFRARDRAGRRQQRGPRPGPQELANA